MKHSNNSLRSHFIGVLLLLTTIPLLAQSSEGTQFWFGFMEHNVNRLNTKVAMITSRHNTSGTISVPGENWSESFNVVANEVTLIYLPAFTEVIGSETIEQKGIFIKTQLAVSVYIHQYFTFSAEASIVLPQSAIGNEYYTMCFQGLTEDQADEMPPEFLLIGTEDNTNITITPSDNTLGGRVRDVPFDIVLNKGDTYQVQGEMGHSKLTGSHIIGDKNFVVFAGSRRSKIPHECLARDNLIEQMPPLDTWSKRYVTVPHFDLEYDIFKILAAEDNTNITIHTDIPTNFTLNKGDVFEYDSDEASFIEADKPIIIAQYMIGSECNGLTSIGGDLLGDPAMVILPGINQTKDTITLYNSTFQNISRHYINVIMSTDDVPFVEIDGESIQDNSSIQTIGLNDEFSYAQVRVSGGSHTLSSTGCGLTATAYGYGFAESYAYTGGAGFFKNENLIPDGGCLNDTVFFNTSLPTPKFSFIWDLGDGTISTEDKFEHIYPELGLYPVQLIITNHCLNTSDTLTKDILISLRQAVNTLDDVKICEGESFQLGATDVTDAEYEWTGPNNFFSEDQFPSFFNSQLNLSGEYIVISIVSGCESYPKTNIVEVSPIPNPSLGDDQIFCGLEENIFLNPGIFTSYRWQDNSSSSTLAVTEEGQYTVEVTNEGGCMGLDSVFLQEICPAKVYVPNIFSPNSDGINDKFGPYLTNVISMEFSIFDRWGGLLFTTTDPTQFWDGQFKGKILTQGIYVWQLKIQGDKRDGGTFDDVLSGSVMLVR